MSQMPNDAVTFNGIPKSKAEQILDKEINQHGHKGAEDFKLAVEKSEQNASSNSSVLSTFEALELDGIGYEVFLSGNTGGVVAGVGLNLGMSVLWILDEDSPDYGGPYYYVFGAASASVGVNLGASLEEGVMGFIAWFEGADKDMTTDDWGGVAHQLALQGALSVGGGLGLDVSYTSSNVPLSGLVSLFSETDEVWRAVGGEVTVLEGTHGAITLEYSHVRSRQTTYEQAMDYLAGVDDQLEDRVTREVNRELHDQGLITDEGYWDIGQIEQYFLRGG